MNALKGDQVAPLLLYIRACQLCRYYGCIPTILLVSSKIQMETPSRSSRGVSGNQEHHSGKAASQFLHQAQQHCPSDNHSHRIAPEKHLEVSTFYFFTWSLKFLFKEKSNPFHLKRKYSVSSKKCYFCQLNVIVRAQDALDEKVRLATVVYEPCKIANRTSVYAVLWRRWCL
jgi:hypothetical protein